jgi:citrate lyase subunit beta/citryl-CoA lyase
MTHKPKRRSLLFVPAIRPRFLARALGREADTLILDLEDSVAGAAKEEARQNLRAWWPAAYVGPQELALRINPLDSEYYARDIDLLRALHPHSVVLPKAETSAQVTALSAQLDDVTPLLERPIEIIPMIETLQGLDHLRDILAASPRVTALLVGAEDLVSEMGVARGSLAESPLLNHALIQVALACHARRVQALGPIHRGYGSEEHLRALEGEATYLRRLNYRGQSAIHPTQLPMLNRVFEITPEEIARARRVAALFEDTERQGSAVVAQGGEMEDLPSLQAALALLRYAEEHGFSG